MCELPRDVLIPLALAEFVPQPFADQLYELNGATMGTTWSVRFCASAHCDPERVRRALQLELDLIVVQMSHWYAESVLCRYNRAPAGSWHRLPEPFWSVIEAGLQIAQLSHGAFDPTLGALVDLWGFGPPGPCSQLPDSTAIELALARSGWKKLSLRIPERQILQPGGLALDLSGIAKGFAVDRLADRLTQLGYDNYLVEVGGELRGFGIKPDASPWWVGPEMPDGLAVSECVIALHGLAIASSGDYQRGFHLADRYYSHTIDPRNGEPLQNAPALVTVLHSQCMFADAWATALTVLPAAQGLALANSEQLAARIVGRDGAVLSTVAWNEMLDE